MPHLAHRQPHEFAIFVGRITDRRARQPFVILNRDDRRHYVGLVLVGRGDELVDPMRLGLHVGMQQGEPLELAGLEPIERHRPEDVAVRREQAELHDERFDLMLPGRRAVDALAHTHRERDHHAWGTLRELAPQNDLLVPPAY